MSITQVDLQSTPYSINTDAIVLYHGNQVPVRILEFKQGAHGAIRAICRLWEPSEDRMGRRHGNKYHLYADNSVALLSENVAIPLASFLRPVEVLHYLSFRKLDLVWQQDTYFFAYIYDQGNKAQRASSASLPSPRGRAASFRIIGTMIRNAISGGMRYRGANKYKTALVFPFSRDEILAVLRATIGAPTTSTTTGVVYRVDSPDQLDGLCKECWDVKVFHNTDHWFNAVTSVTIRLPTSNRVTLDFRFALMRRVFDVNYRAHTLQYFH